MRIFCFSDSIYFLCLFPLEKQYHFILHRLNSRERPIWFLEFVEIKRHHTDERWSMFWISIHRLPQPCQMAVWGGVISAHIKGGAGKRKREREYFLNILFWMLVINANSYNWKMVRRTLQPESFYSTRLCTSNIKDTAWGKWSES